ncbi:MAG: hypothetical protein H7A37_02640 [Chlamydiales bacterium]|nr:hypothetical protein [Chlamydiia bacterium]MCP5507186.1 hypothetical protein [Chlamydiales bacterium]
MVNWTQFRTELKEFQNGEIPEVANGHLRKKDGGPVDEATMQMFEQKFSDALSKKKNNRIEETVTALTHIRFACLQQEDFDSYKRFRQLFIKSWSGKSIPHLPLKIEHVVESWKLLSELIPEERLCTNDEYSEKDLDPIRCEERHFYKFFDLHESLTRWWEQAFQVKRIWLYCDCAHIICEIGNNHNNIKKKNISEYLEASQKISRLADGVFNKGLPALVSTYRNRNEKIAKELELLIKYFSSLTYHFPPPKCKEVPFETELKLRLQSLKKQKSKINNLEKQIEDHKRTTKKYHLNKWFNHSLFKVTKKQLASKKSKDIEGVDEDEWEQEPTPMLASRSMTITHEHSRYWMDSQQSTSNEQGKRACLQRARSELYGQEQRKALLALAAAELKVRRNSISGNDEE